MLACHRNGKSTTCHEEVAAVISEDSGNCLPYFSSSPKVPHAEVRAS